LTDSFQQYAVIKQAAATNNLQLKTVHKSILCKNVPVGNKLSATQYNQGQATNAKFSACGQLAKAQVQDWRELCHPVIEEGLHSRMQLASLERL
jgi:hypothetical protein